MGRNYAITIGINGYRYLQRLNYAQHDADAVRQLFLQELGFQQVYHFTDDSPDIPQDYGPDLESRPTATTLGRFLRTRFEKPFLRDGDNLWFFFAGHGIRHQNRDYLMPMDGDRGDLERSAIPIHYISERLRRSGADNVILLIDACRSFEGKRDGYGIGTEKQQGVITLFSCSPEESSYEIEELRRGAFTHVLLESLRRQGEGNCATVERLYQQLRYDVPQLTRQYKRVRQTPYGVIEPPTKNHLILLPQSATLADIVTLKNDALRAEVQKDFRQAKQYWVRVLAASPADPEAIEGIERLSRMGITGTPPPVPPSPPDSSSQTKARSATTSQSVTPRSKKLSRLGSSSSLPQLPMNRRRAIKLLGFSGGGVGVVLVGRAIQQAWQVDSGDSSSAKPTEVDAADTGSDAVRDYLEATGDSVDGLENAPDASPLTAADFTPFDFEVVTVNETGAEVSRETKQAQVFREEIGDVALELVAIPGGTFMMGSPADEESRTDSEGPQHEVTVPQFLMGKYQVTQAQYQAVMGNNPSFFTDNGTNRPVENVTWNDAVEFCQKLSQQTGREYRLPSEAEWEYACRAGTTTPFHFGPTITTDLVNYNGEAYGSAPKGEYRLQTTNVGSFPANAFGLYDVHGNVYEWCLDHWHDSYEEAPTDGSAWTTGGDELLRVQRGGSWFSNPYNCRSAFRIWPNHQGAANSIFRRDNKGDYIGFRVVCTSSWTFP